MFRFVKPSWWRPADKSTPEDEVNAVPTKKTDSDSVGPLIEDRAEIFEHASDQAGQSGRGNASNTSDTVQPAGSSPAVIQPSMNRTDGVTEARYRSTYPAPPPGKYAYVREPASNRDNEQSKPSSTEDSPPLSQQPSRETTEPTIAPTTSESIHNISDDLAMYDHVIPSDTFINQIIDVQQTLRLIKTPFPSLSDRYSKIERLSLYYRTIAAQCDHRIIDQSFLEDEEAMRQDLQNESVNCTRCVGRVIQAGEEKMEMDQVAFANGGNLVGSTERLREAVSRDKELLGRMTSEERVREAGKGNEILRDFYLDETEKVLDAGAEVEGHVKGEVEEKSGLQTGVKKKEKKSRLVRKKGVKDGSVLGADPQDLKNARKKKKKGAGDAEKNDESSKLATTIEDVRTRTKDENVKPWTNSISTTQQQIRQPFFESLYSDDHPVQATPKTAKQATGGDSKSMLIDGLSAAKATAFAKSINALTYKASALVTATDLETKSISAVEREQKVTSDRFDEAVAGLLKLKSDVRSLLEHSPLISSAVAADKENIPPGSADTLSSNRPHVIEASNNTPLHTTRLTRSAQPTTPAPPDPTPSQTTLSLPLASAKIFMQDYILTQRASTAQVDRWCEMLSHPSTFTALRSVIPELWIENNIVTDLNPMVQKLLEATKQLRPARLSEDFRVLEKKGGKRVKLEAGPTALEPDGYAYKEQAAGKRFSPVFNVTPPQMRVPSFGSMAPPSVEFALKDVKEVTEAAAALVAPKLPPRHPRRTKVTQLPEINTVPMDWQKIHDDLVVLGLLFKGKGLELLNWAPGTRWIVPMRLFVPDEDAYRAVRLGGEKKLMEVVGKLMDGPDVSDGAILKWPRRMRRERAKEGGSLSAAAGERDPWREKSGVAYWTLPREEEEESEDEDRAPMVRMRLETLRKMKKFVASALKTMDQAQDGAKGGPLEEGTAK